MKELLEKFFSTPGLCSLEELDKVKKFILAYKEYIDIYYSATYRFPLGETLTVEVANVDWYINWNKEK